MPQRPAALALAALAATAALAQTALAQQRQAPASAPSQSARPQRSAFELSDETFRLETVGLAVRLPVGAEAQKSRIGDQMAGQITSAPGAAEQWLLTIQTPQSRNASIAPQQVATEVLEQIRGQFGRVVDGKVAQTEAAVIEPVRAVNIRGEGADMPFPAARFYVRTPAGTGRNQVVRGYTVVGIGGGRFIVFDLTTPLSSFDAVRPLYEAMIATAEITDPTRLAESRARVVTAGVELLASLKPEDYDAAIASMQDQWFRLYRPAPTAADADATEIGYMRVRAKRGQRGELDGAASANWGELERQQGYIVRIEARQLQGDQVVDSIGQYFMSLDRKEEMWALRLAARNLSSRRVVQSLTEIGARSGTSMSVTVSGSTEPRSISPFVPDTGYLNQVEMFLLPALLVRSKAGDGQAREVGFYTYQSEFNNVRLRRDAVRADASRLGAIRITTQTSEDRDPIVSIYNQRGELIQTTTADGSVREPIELPRLMDLWKRKNLPID